MLSQRRRDSVVDNIPESPVEVHTKSKIQAIDASLNDSVQSEENNDNDSLINRRDKRGSITDSDQYASTVPLDNFSLDKENQSDEKKSSVDETDKRNETSGSNEQIADTVPVEQGKVT